MHRRVDEPTSTTDRWPAGRGKSRHLRLIVVSLASVLAAVLALGACSSSKKSEGAKASTSQGGSAAAPSGDAVQIMNFEFQPQKLTVKAGAKVTWTNQDSSPHSIKDTSPLATPVSTDLAKGDTFSITYDKPGSYSYICGIHNYMTGSVEVTG